MNTNTEIVTTSNNLALIRQAVANDPQLPSKHSKRQYIANLAAFEAFRSGNILTKALVNSYAAKLQEEGKAPNTINQKLASVRWYARTLKDFYIDQDDAGAQEIARKAERVAEVKGVKGDRPPRGRAVDAGELAALMKICEADTTPAGSRDAALFAIAWVTGIRRASLCDLTIGDIAPGESQGEADLIVHGKRNKVIKAYVNNGAYEALQDWLSVRGMGDGPLFVTIGKGGNITGARLSGEALRKILVKRAKQAGIAKLTTWHDFRYSFASHLLDDNVDLATVQKLMGHSSAGTTANYDRRPEAARRKAVKVLFVPYHKKVS